MTYNPQTIFGTEIRGFPQANSIVSTDAFLIDRLGVGTMFIEAQDFLGGSSVYDIAMDLTGDVPANSLLFVFNAVRNYTLPVGLTGAQFSLQQGASPDNDHPFVLSIQKNGTEIGTATCPQDSTDFTISFTSLASFAAGDQLMIVSGVETTGAQTLAITIPADLS